METRPDADPAWRCPHGQACFHFDAALRKDIVDDMLRRYGLEFKYRYEEVPRPMTIDPAPIVITAPMMIDPAFPVWREGRDSSIKRLGCLRAVRQLAKCSHGLRERGSVPQIAPQWDGRFSSYFSLHLRRFCPTQACTTPNRTRGRRHAR